MKRRNFLKATGAFAGIEFDTDGAIEDGAAIAMDQEARSTTDDRMPLDRLASSLPKPSQLADGADYAVSLTRLDHPAVTLTGGAMDGASAYGTLFTSRRSIDIAFEVDADEVEDWLVADGFAAIDAVDGWSVFHGRRRARHRVAAVADSLAVVATGTVSDAVRSDVDAVATAVEQSAVGSTRNPGMLGTMVDTLGEGTHLSVDLSPDASHVPASVAATGERIAIMGANTVARRVTMFDSVRHAREPNARSLESEWRLDGTQVSERSTWTDDRGVVQELTVPTDQVLSMM